MVTESKVALATRPDGIEHGPSEVLSPPGSRAYAVFAILVLLALGTVPWRVSILTWRPLLRVDFPPFPAVEVGILSLLPILLFAGWVAMRVRQRRMRLWQWGARVVFLPLVGLSLLGLLGLRDMSPESLVQLGGLGVMWLVYLFVVNESVVNESVVNERLHLPLVFAAVVLLQGAVAVGQFVRQADLGLAALGEPTLNLAEYSINVLQARGHAWIRAYGLTPGPNVLGACLAILLVLLLPFMLSEIAARTTVKPPHVWRLTLTLAMTAGVLGLLASFSRAAAWSGFAAGAAVCLWTALFKGGKGPHSEVTRRARAVSAWWLAPLVGGLLFAAMYGDLALSRLVHLDTPTEARSLSERERDVSLAWEIIQAHPWRGVGTGNYESAARAINPDAAEVHNIPLMVTAEWGLPGAALWLLLAVIGLRRASRARAAWLALLVISLFDLSLWPTTSWHGAILFGLLAAQIAMGQSQPAPMAVSTGLSPSSWEEGNAYRI